MSTNYPTSQDSTVVPGSKLSSNPHSTLHIDDRDAIRAIQSKVGTGSTAQSASDRAFLMGTGSGASKWETAPSNVGLTNPTLTGADMNGTELILDADADTSITADTDDQIDFKLNGADDFRMTANTFTALSGSAISTNTINETTAANGVTVDGLNIKDSKLNADDSVIPNNLAASTGTSWVWQSWTPTWTNVSGGTLNYAKYTQIGKSILFRVKYTLAGAGVSGAIIFTSPVAMNADYGIDDPLTGDAAFLDSGNNLYPGKLLVASSTTIRLRPVVASGTYAAIGTDTSSSIPFSWGATDIIMASGVAQVA
jgi:hypothetical protein